MSAAADDAADDAAAAWPLGLLLLLRAVSCLRRPGVGSSGGGTWGCGARVPLLRTRAERLQGGSALPLQSHRSDGWSSAAFSRGGGVDAAAAAFRDSSESWFS